MLDELRQQIQTRLDELLGEADKLRHAIVAGCRSIGGSYAGAGMTPRA